jgi:hypothetical protein
MITPKTAPMPDLFSFLLYGFRNFWRPKAVWVFSLLLFLFTTFFDIVISLQTQRLLREVYSLISGLLSFMYVIGIYYIAYNYFLDKTLSIKQIIGGIRKYLWGGIACEIVNGMILMPVACTIIFTQYILHSQSVDSLLPQIFLFFYIYAFTAFLIFPIFELFDKNLSIGKSIKNGNRVFGNKFFVLGVLGIIMGCLQQIWGFLSKILTSFVETIITLPPSYSFGTFFYNPSVDPNPFFMILKSVGSIISVPIIAFVFISAYFKYHSPLTSELIPGESVDFEKQSS